MSIVREIKLSTTTVVIPAVVPRPVALAIVESVWQEVQDRGQSIWPHQHLYLAVDQLDYVIATLGPVDGARFEELLAQIITHGEDHDVYTAIVCAQPHMLGEDLAQALYPQLGAGGPMGLTQQ